MHISDRQPDIYRKQGFLIVGNLLSEEERRAGRLHRRGALRAGVHVAVTPIAVELRIISDRDPSGCRWPSAMHR